MSRDQDQSTPRRRADPDFGRRAGFLVHDVSRLRRIVFDGAMRPHGLTRSQWWVLAQLSRHGDRAMSQAELAKHLDVGKAALGGLIDRLEAVGYVQRTPAPGDRRVNLVSVTPKGREVTGVMRAIGHGLTQKIFDGFSEEQVHALETALGRIKANLLGMVAEQGGDPATDEADRQPETSLANV